MEELKTRKLDFRKRVYKILKTIPKGKVISYQKLAELAGNPMAARAVGTLMKKNPNPKIIPCFKVIKSDRSIGYYSAKGGIKRKIQLLKKDGIKIKNGKILPEYMYK